MGTSAQRCYRWGGALTIAPALCGGNDLTRPVTAVRERFPKKRVVAAFPPNRASKHLRKAATASFTIGRDAFRDSQLPDRVVKPDGYVLTLPTKWS